jgi:malate dehydrogenase
MFDVAIVGAGELGGALAHRLARRDVVASIALVDENGSMAAGKALDIMQAAPIERFATAVAGSADISTLPPAAIFVLADRAAGGARPVEEGLALLQRAWRSAPGSVIVCAHADARELVERGVREIEIPRTRVCGSAPEALAAAVRACVAVETGGSPQDVALTLLGIPPSQIIIPWEEAAIGGLAAMRSLDTPAIRRLSAWAESLWPPGAHALAMAAMKAIENIVGRGRRTMTCFVGPDDSAGRRARAVALPVRMGPAGIVSVTTPDLNARDRIALENAMLL